jgi:hypothetical protein
MALTLTTEAPMQSNRPQPGDFVGYTSRNGRVRMCARVVDPADMYRAPQTGMVWIRETGLRSAVDFGGERFICEAPIECLTIEARA